MQNPKIRLNMLISEWNQRLPARQCECILSWASKKLAQASGILYRTYKGHLFSGECPKNLVSPIADVFIVLYFSSWQ